MSHHILVILPVFQTYIILTDMVICVSVVFDVTITKTLQLAEDFDDDYRFQYNEVFFT